MSQYFSEPNEHSDGNINVELGLSNSTTEIDLKGATGIDRSNLASKSDLTGLKTKLNYCEIDKLKSVPADVSKLGNVADNIAVKKSSV